jgi:uncharacterized protein YigE (DUF2233 family)
MRLLAALSPLMVFFLISCKDDSIAAKLYRKCNGQEKCLQPLKSVTNFKWQKVYVFRAGASLEEIEKVLGIPYKQWQDIGDRIIFVDNGQVVYHEDYFPYPEHVENGSTQFELSIEPYVGEFDKAMFSVTKQKTEKGDWYYLVEPIR